MAPDRAKSRVVAAGGSNTGDANKIAGTMNTYSFASNPSKPPLVKGGFKTSPLTRGIEGGGLKGYRVLVGRRHGDPVHKS